MSIKLDKINSIKTNQTKTSYHEISNKININTPKLIQGFSKETNFETQSSSDNIIKNKIKKSQNFCQNLIKKNEPLNQTSHFINNVSFQNESLHRNNSSNANKQIYNLFYDKITFKNSSYASYKEDEINNNEESGKNLKSLFLIENNNKKINRLITPELNQLINKNLNYSIGNITNSEIKKSIYSSVELTQKKNILNPNTIPMFTKQLLLKAFNTYLSKNKITVYSKETDDKNINGFSALTFRNECPKCNTKISININIKNKFGIFHFFDLHSVSTKKDILKSKITFLSDSNNIIDNNFFSDIIGNLVILKFYNDKVFVISNKEYNSNKLFPYKGIFSINNGSKIESFNNLQNITSQQNLDFILLFNRGIFQVLSNKEIAIIIYKTLIENISNNNSFEKLLGNIVKNIFNGAINYGENRDMASLFICFKNFKKIFEEKNIKKILEICYNIEKGISDEVEKFNDSYSPQKSIKVKNNDNLTFKEIKSNISEETIRYISKDLNKKKHSFFTCCGLFN